MKPPMKPPMTTHEIARAIRSGESVAAIAARLNVSPSRIYNRLRSAGTPAQSLRPKRKRVKYVELKNWPGYRVGNDGSVQSCVSPRSGAANGYWRDLAAIRQQNMHVVSFGASNGPTRKRWSLRTLLVMAWGEAVGQRIYERVTRT